MACPFLLFTNNPAFFTLDRQGLDVMPVEATAHDVLLLARDKVHAGWRILNHPLYGNFRPGHQPFRTMLLQAPQPLATPSASVAAVDTYSLDLMEQALGVYRACADRVATPQGVSETLFRDCSRIDQALMQATLDNYTSA